VRPGSLTGTDGLSVRVVPGGHYLPEERPDVVAATVRSLPS
jgi:hypothetical protein